MGQSAKVGLMGILVLLGLMIAVFKKNRPRGEDRSQRETAETAWEMAGESTDTGAELGGSYGRQPNQIQRRVGPGAAGGSTSGRQETQTRTTAGTNGGNETTETQGPVRAGSSAEHEEPEVTSAESESASSQKTTYVVQKGDSFSRIAARFYGTGRNWRRLYEANRDVCRSPERLQPGTTLVIPDFTKKKEQQQKKQSTTSTVRTGRTHRVTHGDTLSRLAHKYYGDRKKWRTIYEANEQRIPDPDRLRLGTELVIPE